MLTVTKCFDPPCIFTITPAIVIHVNWMQYVLISLWCASNDQPTRAIFARDKQELG